MSDQQQNQLPEQPAKIETTIIDSSESQPGSSNNPPPTSSLPTEIKSNSLKRSSHGENKHIAVKGTGMIKNPKKVFLEFQKLNQLDNSLTGNFNLNLEAEDPIVELKEKLVRDLNFQLDNHVDGMIDSVYEIINTSSVEDKDGFKIFQEQYNMNSRVANLVRCCESILNMSSELKLNILLNDTSQFATEAHDFSQSSKTVPQAKKQKVEDVLEGKNDESKLEEDKNPGEKEKMDEYISYEDSLKVQFLESLPNTKKNCWEKYKDLDSFFS